MATKRYGQQEFTAEVNGKVYTFHCWTTNTRSGFCHSCANYGGLFDTVTKIGYLNRSWESFRYESVLARSIDKCPKGMQKELRKQLIDKTAKEEREKAEAFVSAFQAEHEKLSDRNKEILANSPTIETQEQAEGVLGVMRMMNAFDALKSL